MENTWPNFHFMAPMSDFPLDRQPLISIKNQLLERNEGKINISQCDEDDDDDDDEDWEK